MRIISAKTSLTLGVITVFTALAFMVSPLLASAQSNGPDFQITSSKDISAIAGESFTYFVVTENNTDFQLASQLPAGLSFADNQISGVPQETGEFAIDFTATDDSGSTLQTVNLTVMSPSGSSADGSSGNTGSSGNSGSSDNQMAQSQESVSLNEVPDTGLSADQALTVSFYALALLLLSWLAVRKLSPRLAATESQMQTTASRQSDDLHQSQVDQPNTEPSRQVGDGITSDQF